MVAGLGVGGSVVCGVRARWGLVAQFPAPLRGWGGPGFACLGVGVNQAVPPPVISTAPDRTHVTNQARPPSARQRELRVVVLRRRAMTMPPPPTTRAAAVPANAVVPLLAPVSARWVPPPAGDGALLAAGTGLLLAVEDGDEVGVALGVVEEAGDGVEDVDGSADTDAEADAAAPHVTSGMTTSGG